MEWFKSANKGEYEALMGGHAMPEADKRRVTADVLRDLVEEVERQRVKLSQVLGEIDNVAYTIWGD
jgi:hypothetical protein